MIKQSEIKHAIIYSTLGQKQIFNSYVNEKTLKQGIERFKERFARYNFSYRTAKIKITIEEVRK